MNRLKKMLGQFQPVSQTSSEVASTPCRANTSEQEVFVIKPQSAKSDSKFEPFTSHKFDSNLFKRRKVALIMGAGDGLGSGIVRKFVSEGFVVVAARRNGSKLANLLTTANKAALARFQTPLCFGYSVDARNEDSVCKFVEHVECTYGQIEFACYNIGANVRFPIHKTTSRVFFKVWEMACFGAFLFGREVSKRMVERGKGCIIFTGATASIRGNPGYTAFSSAKAGTRMIAQSMAKELAPRGVHVAHVVVDGAIDGVFIRGLLQKRKEGKVEDARIDESKNELFIMKPESIAESYWMLYKQEKSAWTFELDLRPFVEKWS